MNDRFLRACRREVVDATPVWFMRQAGRSLPEYRALRRRASLNDIVADPALCAEVTLQPVRRLRVDAAILFADITTPLPGIGLEVTMVEGSGPVVAEPVRSDADLARLHALEPTEAVGPLLAAIGFLRRELRVPLIGFAGAPFTLACYVVEGRAARDPVRLKAMLHADPRLFGSLLGTLTDMTIAYLRAQAAAGVQALQVFDSWIGALGPFDYRRAVLPHMRRLFESLADLGLPTIHFGTGTAGLLPLMAEGGGDVMGIDWRVALGQAREALPGRALQGNLDPAVMLGPWEAVEAQAAWVLGEAAGRPGHVFNLGHGVLPDTHPDQLARLVDLVHARTADRAAVA